MRKTVIITAILYALIIWAGYIPPKYIQGHFLASLLVLFIWLVVLFFLGLVCSVVLTLWFDENTENKFKKSVKFGLPIPALSFLLGKGWIFLQYFLTKQ